MKIAIVRERLVRFFQEHNPERLQIVDDIIARYHDEPAQLFKDLEDRYGVPVPEVDEKDLPHETNHVDDDDVDGDHDVHDNLDDDFNNQRQSGSNLTSENLASQNDNVVDDDRSKQQNNNNNGKQEMTSYHSGESHPMNKRENQQVGNDKTLTTQNTVDGKNKNDLFHYAEPDAEALAQMDDWEFEGLPIIDPRFDLPFYVKPVFDKAEVKVDSGAAFGSHHQNQTQNQNKNNNKHDEDDSAKNNSKKTEKKSSNEPEYFTHFSNLINNHAIYWFSLVKKHTEALFSKFNTDNRVLFATERCLFLSKPTAEAEITRIIYIHEIACVFTNYEFVEKNVKGIPVTTTPTTTTPKNEENFIVFKILPYADKDEEDLESGFYDLYISLPTIQETKNLLRVLSQLYRCNPFVQRSKEQTELLVTPIAKNDPVSNTVVQLNLKRPSYLANRLLNIPQEAQPKSRKSVLKELREFADKNGIIYSRTGKVKKAPKAFLIDADGRPSLITKRRSGVIVPITGLQAVVKEDKRRQKNQLRNEAMEMVKKANRTIQDEMLHDPHRTVMNDPSDILAYRNQKSLQGQRAADVSRVTAEFAARSQYLQENSPARGFLMKMLAMSQQHQQSPNNFSSSPSSLNALHQLSPISPQQQHALSQHQETNNNYNNNNNSNQGGASGASGLLQRIPSSILSSSSATLLPGSRSTPLNQQRDREILRAQQKQQEDQQHDHGNNDDDEDGGGVIRASIPSPTRMRQFNENQLLQYVAPTLSESWKVLQEAAPPPIQGYVGDSVGGALGLYKTEGQKRNIIRRVGFDSPRVIDVNKYHAETKREEKKKNVTSSAAAVVLGVQDVGNDNSKALVSPEKAWSRGGGDESVGGGGGGNNNKANAIGLGVSVVSAGRGDRDNNNNHNQNLGNSFVNRQPSQQGGASITSQHNSNSNHHHQTRSVNTALAFPVSSSGGNNSQHPSTSTNGGDAIKRNDLASQESFHLGY